VSDWLVSHAIKAKDDVGLTIIFHTYSKLTAMKVVYLTSCPSHRSRAPPYSVEVMF